MFPEMVPDFCRILCSHVDPWRTEWRCPSVRLISLNIRIGLTDVYANEYKTAHVSVPATQILCSAHSIPIGPITPFIMPKPVVYDTPRRCRFPGCNFIAYCKDHFMYHEQKKHWTQSHMLCSSPPRPGRYHYLYCDFSTDDAKEMEEHMAHHARDMSYRVVNPHPDAAWDTVPTGP
ncbi:hypothetical protein OBBRIDRAFT_296203 [Obba rivulosa]|uniref:C2H2-type domain-containing protein n=1 Tax=Obba rivulosa TaxID=1052685 RepID=A0A8E2DKB4_9APHY|nr:hypothetical protein OBBRIDRAFT_296203 [Obba rivulosa]